MKLVFHSKSISTKTSLSYSHRELLRGVRMTLGWEQGAFYSLVVDSAHLWVSQTHSGSAPGIEWCAHFYLYKVQDCSGKTSLFLPDRLPFSKSFSWNFFLTYLGSVLVLRSESLKPCDHGNSWDFPSILLWGSSRLLISLWTFLRMTWMFSSVWLTADMGKAMNRSQNFSIIANQQHPWCNGEGTGQVWETDFNRQEGDRKGRADACASVCLILPEDMSPHHPGEMHTLMGFDHHLYLITTLKSRVLELTLLLLIPQTTATHMWMYICTHAWNRRESMLCT